MRKSRFSESQIVSVLKEVESVHGVPLMNPEAPRQALFERIAVEYNRTRRDSTLG